MNYSRDQADMPRDDRERLVSRRPQHGTPKGWRGRIGPRLPWLPLRYELSRWRALGRRPRCWLRDDDARTSSPALQRLLNLTARAGVPLSLAVIPDGTLAELAMTLGREPLVTVLQHGTDHRNRRGHAEPCGEIPATAQRHEIEARLHPAADRFRRHWPEGPFGYVPPWNDTHPLLPSVLAAAGFAALSAAGASLGWHERLFRCDVHVDLLRWKPNPAGRPPLRVASRIARELRRRRMSRSFAEPVGILSHHLEHDELAWELLETLLGFEGIDWIGWPEILSDASALSGERSGFGEQAG